ncbi:MAG: efflux RND transporter periplasmic adaptor subunit [Pseudomonadota bacterium]
MNKPLDQTQTVTAQPQPDKAPVLRRWLVLLFALAALAAVVMFLSTAEDTVDATRTTAPVASQQVTVETVTTEPQTAQVSAFAEVRPRWSAELRAAVPGRVERVFDSALAGEHVKAGTELIRIENSRYVAEVAAAELSLKQAQLVLWRAENATTLARKEFERNRTAPPNDLALRLPELEIARSTVESAEASLAAARQQLEDTRISAPFSGFISDRFISPGQTVSVGEPLVKLVDDRVFELVAELSRTDWDLLAKPLQGSSARVIDQTGGQVARATIRRAGGFLDETTRQHKVFLDIAEPAAGNVLPGDFVRVILPGRTIPQAMNLPASALSQEGFVWHVDENNRLQRFAPRVLFRKQDRVVIEAPDTAPDWQIATNPLISFLPGQIVVAIDSGD